MKLFLAISISTSLVLVGCSSAVDSEVTRSEADRNAKEFSQESYEAAMIKSGKGAELEAEKKRNAAHLAGEEPAPEQPAPQSSSDSDDADR